MLGGGFAGINFVKKLANDNRFQVTLVDRPNRMNIEHNTSAKTTSVRASAGAIPSIPGNEALPPDKSI